MSGQCSLVPAGTGEAAALLSSPSELAACLLCRSGTALGMEGRTLLRLRLRAVLHHAPPQPAVPQAPDT